MKLAIKKRDILFFILLLPFFTPEGMSTIGAGGHITNAGFLKSQFFAVSTTTLYWARNLIGNVILFCLPLHFLKARRFGTLRNRKYYPIASRFSLYAFWTLIVSILNSREMYDLFILLGFCTGYLFMLEWMLAKYTANTLRVFVTISRLLLAVNLLLMILFPHGITTGTDYLNTPYYFLGTKNQITPFLILSLTIEFLWQTYNDSKKYTALVIGAFLVLANAFGMGSSTSILTAIVMFLGVPISRRGKLQVEGKRLFNGRSLVVIAALISIGVVFFDIQNIF